ncbi:hypothetical protein [Zhongshania aquimaris]|jgi:hypothetical protein|uniref:Uncharacterized protein n=1 Tax=Zhongshania aquimaris TaxID=2857107 RepID=A0ABS6VLP1_9GAMM|nr:hypothetical protein [Zhongshania aquimaris]MBQ0759060.1 hypothetical protein [Zhongshania sp.]MBW2939227.1 hypothetical protein [Zhongshania aquimaris]|tara:strand:- start:4296 stop:4622 length:327 start_codon:yes stop_codon:yes gene_type:complete
MLLASYLLGFDNKDSVKHLAVDNILPEQLDCVEMRLFSRGRCDDSVTEVVDLIMLFADAPAPNNIVCLPSLPDNAVKHLLAGKPLQVIDFAHGRKLSLVYPLDQQRCA